MNIRNKIHREEKKKKLKTKYSEINKMNMQIKETEINSSEIQRISTIASNLKDDKRKFIYIVSEIQKVQDINKNGNKIISQVNKNLIKNRTNFKLRHNFMNLVILLIKTILIFIEINQENSLLEFTEINLKINATGNNKILSDDFFKANRPHEIYLLYFLFLYLHLKIPNQKKIQLILFLTIKKIKYNKIENQIVSTLK